MGSYVDSVGATPAMHACRDWQLRSDFDPAIVKPPYRGSRRAWDDLLRDRLWYCSIHYPLPGHLRDKHKYSEVVGNELVRDILRKARLLHTEEVSKSLKTADYARSLVLSPDQVPKCLEGAMLTAEQQVYWNAPESLTHKSQALQAVPFLPIIEGMQCPAPNCMNCYASKDSLRLHYKKHRHEAGVIFPLPDACKVRVQSLSKHGIRCKYFPVYEVDQFVRTDPSPRRVRFADSANASAPVSSDTPCPVSIENENEEPVLRNVGLGVAQSRNNQQRISGKNVGLCAPSTRGSVIGNMIWDSIKNLNPAFKGAHARHSAAAIERSGSAATLRTTGDDQLLGSKEASTKQGADMFKLLCNFEELLAFLGYTPLRDVPIELVSLPRFNPLRIRSPPENLLLVSQQRGRKDGSNCETGCETEEYDEDDEDDEYDRNSSIASSARTENQVKCQPDRGGNNGKEVHLGSVLLQEIGFDESLVVDQVKAYLIKCRAISFQCSEAVRRLVHTRERSSSSRGTNGSAHDPQDRFRPSTKDATLRKYAEEVARIVLFCLRLTMVKSVHDGNAFLNRILEQKGPTGNDNEDEEVNRAICEKTCFHKRSVEKLNHVLQKHKPSILSRSAIHNRYGKLLYLLPEEIARPVLSYILDGSELSLVHNAMTGAGTEAAVVESLNCSQISLHAVLCALLLQTSVEPACTNSLFTRHFVSIMSVWHKASRWRNNKHKTGGKPSPEDLAQSAVVSSFVPSSESQKEDDTNNDVAYCKELDHSVLETENRERKSVAAVRGADEADVADEEEEIDNRETSGGKLLKGRTQKQVIIAAKKSSEANCSQAGLAGGGEMSTEKSVITVKKS